MSIEKISIICEACEALSRQDPASAKAIIQNGYPFDPKAVQKRSYSKTQMLRVFIRDGFIDRYSGHPLIFPPVLRILSARFPEIFPYHRNWKMEVTHIAYWELTPTIDHVVPVARGGEDHENNWVTTSMLHNAVKSNWTLEQLGWHLREPGDMSQWDGLLHWFSRYVTDDADLLEVSGTRNWKRAVDQLL